MIDSAKSTGRNQAWRIGKKEHVCSFIALCARFAAAGSSMHSTPKRQNRISARFS